MNVCQKFGCLFSPSDLRLFGVSGGRSRRLRRRRHRSRRRRRKTSSLGLHNAEQAQIMIARRRLIRNSPPPPPPPPLIQKQQPATLPAGCLAKFSLIVLVGGGGVAVSRAINFITTHDKTGQQQEHEPMPIFPQLPGQQSLFAASSSAARARARFSASTPLLTPKGAPLGPYHRYTSSVGVELSIRCGKRGQQLCI